MNAYEWAETILFFVVLLALVKPLGAFMTRIYQGSGPFCRPSSQSPFNTEIMEVDQRFQR
jgi:K+-transporting ATPase A subunit